MNFYCSDIHLTPNNIHLDSVSSGQLNFSWSPLDSNCPGTVYHINATQCGQCPSSTNKTFVSCIAVNTSDDACLFTVQSEVCGHTSSSHGELLMVVLKGNII